MRKDPPEQRSRHSSHAASQMLGVYFMHAETLQYIEKHCEKLLSECVRPHPNHQPSHVQLILKLFQGPNTVVLGGGEWCSVYTVVYG